MEDHIALTYKKKCDKDLSKMEKINKKLAHKINFVNLLKLFDNPLKTAFVQFLDSEISKISAVMLTFLDMRMFSPTWQTSLWFERELFGQTN